MINLSFIKALGGAILSNRELLCTSVSIVNNILSDNEVKSKKKPENFVHNITKSTIEMNKNSSKDNMNLIKFIAKQ